MSFPLAIKRPKLCESVAFSGVRVATPGAGTVGAGTEWLRRGDEDGSIGSVVVVIFGVFVNYSEWSANYSFESYGGGGCSLNLENRPRT